ncbi:MAG: cupin domain-containing protein [Acidobacteriota bacterium]
MIGRASTDEMIDVAALYALGALSQHEARSFERHLDEGCADCGSELQTFAKTVAALAFSVADEQPPARLRALLLDRIGDSDSQQPKAAKRAGNANNVLSILASDGEWQELQNGVLLKQLYLDETTGIATSLVRMQPGTALPIHQHIGVEQFFVIEGDCNVAGQTLGAGDYHRAETGTIHETTYTVDGTLLLLIAPERYEVLDAR